MKLLCVILLVCASTVLKANNPYRNYLLLKISYDVSTNSSKSQKISFAKTNCVIPRFERPKGAVFCRMEDYLTAKTNLWIKVGVK